MSEVQHVISSAHLSIEKIDEILKTNVRLKLSEDSIKKIKKCRKYLDLKAKERRRSVLWHKYWFWVVV